MKVMKSGRGRMDVMKDIAGCGEGSDEEREKGRMFCRIL